MNRTSEFQSILRDAAHRQKTGKTSQQRQSLLSDAQKAEAGASPARQRSEFARKAMEISRGIAGTTAKLERLAALARRKTLFDDRPVEINELTFIIKQDLSALDGNIKTLQKLGVAAQPRHEEGEHNKNVVFLLRGKLGDVTSQFKDALELRTKNIQASRSRTENFISSVSAASTGSSLNPSRTDSPLYQTPQQQQGQQLGRRSPGVAPGAAGDILSLDPNPTSSALSLAGPASSQQLLMMEEGGSNTYIQARGEAIETIERTIAELGGIFTQLAQMVSEQGEQIQRIDADTEDVLDNVQGAQRELLKYWGRVQGNRWLVAKMFGVLMVFFLLWVLIAG